MRLPRPQPSGHAREVERIIAVRGGERRKSRKKRDEATMRLLRTVLISRDKVARAVKRMMVERYGG